MSAARALVLAIGLAAVCGPAHGAEADADWAFSATLFGYDVPDSQDYLNPNVTADDGRLHFEARYNYESIDTASIWVGLNFHAGTKWSFDATAMLGAVLGELDGFAPGYRLTLERSWFSLASEGEYFIDTRDHQGNYLFAWTEIAGCPTDWFRAGLVGQRSRAFESELDVQRGIFAAFTYKQLDVAAYVFNLGWEDPSYVLAVRVDF